MAVQEQETTMEAMIDNLVGRVLKGAKFFHCFVAARRGGFSCISVLEGNELLIFDAQLMQVSYPMKLTCEYYPSEMWDRDFIRQFLGRLIECRPEANPLMVERLESAIGDSFVGIKPVEGSLIDSEAYSVVGPDTFYRLAELTIIERIPFGENVPNVYKSSFCTRLAFWLEVNYRPMVQTMKGC